MQQDGKPATDKDDWFMTGDVATIDPLGHMAITDRSKDVIKSGGEWISSIDIENAVMAHPKARARKSSLQCLDLYFYGGPDVMPCMGAGMLR